jgi:hypothetical protein
MRLYKLAPALIAVTSLLALPVAGASARKHPSPNGRCRININVMPGLITAGESTEVSGRLLCNRRANAADKVVKLYAHVAGSAGFVPVQSTTTEANGSYKFAAAAENANTSFYVRSHGAQSGRRRLRVAASVTLSGPPEGTQLLTGVANKVTFTGTVNPTTDVGARVILQRQNAATGGDDWHPIGVGQVIAGGIYSITHVFRVPGDANIRVLVRSDGLNIPSPSNILEYEISQAQNPNLTIQASADPIAFGQTVTISGVLAGGDNMPVTLLARTDGTRFSPVAQVNTDASGNYSFPAQMPVNSTLYRVTAADPACATARPGVAACAARLLKSAVLYEGVKDLLTAEASPTTIKSGEAVTFKGTVAPDHTGHVVYLERQNANNGDFHVVQVGHVLPGSVYAIIHQVYVPGTKVFRVEIPGGPENGRAVSQPFTITVTPAPASSLAPEAPGNSTLPPEGQTTDTETEKPPTE